MKRLCEHTAYLIARHDCVVLPGWGALIAMQTGSVIDHDNGSITPPMRRLTFNGMISHNDGMLASSVARREGISYEAANVIVANDIDALRRQYQTAGTVTLQQIGRFDNNDGSMVFTPADESAANARYHSLKPAQLFKQPETETAADDKKHNDNIVYIPLSRNIFKIAASLMLMISLAMLAWTSIPLERQPDAASLAPKTTRIEHVMPKQPSTAVAVMSQTDTVAPTPDENTPEPVADTVTHPDAPRFDETDSYCLIIASLPNKSDADKYIACSNETTPLGILEQDGRFRVYIATGATQSQAMAQLDVNGIGSRHPEAWTCRRR